MWCASNRVRCRAAAGGLSWSALLGGLVSRRDPGSL